jgi:hypothetical protein
MRSTSVLETQNLEAEVVEAEYLAPSKPERTTSVLHSTSPDLAPLAAKIAHSKPAPRAAPIAGNWRLENLTRVSGRTLATVIITLPPEQISLIARDRNIIAHYACPWTKGETKSAKIVSSTQIHLEVFIPASTLLAIDSLPKTGGAVAGHIDETTGPVIEETR